MLPLSAGANYTLQHGLQPAAAHDNVSWIMKASCAHDPPRIQIIPSHSVSLFHCHGHFDQHSSALVLRSQGISRLRRRAHVQEPVSGLPAARTSVVASQTIHAGSPGRDIRQGAAVLHLELPTLECTFPANYYPGFEKVEEECEEWAMSLFEPPLSPEDRLLFRTKRLSLFTSLNIPSASSLRRFTLITKLFNWLTCVDDILEPVDEHQATVLSEFERGLLHILGNFQARRSTTPADDDDDDVASIHAGWSSRLLERLQHDIWDEICQDASSQCTDRLARLLYLSVLTITRDEHSFRRSKPAQNAATVVDDFLEFRARTSFVPLMWALLEYSLQTELDEARPEALELPQDSIIRAILAQHFKMEEHIAPALGPAITSATRQRVNEVLAEHERNAAKHVMAVNDYISFRAEFSRNDFHSLPGLFFMQRGGDVQQLRAAISTGERNSSFDILQDAVYEVYNIIKEQEGLAASLMGQIKSMHAAGSCSEDTLRYAEELCNAMAGMIHWSNISSRYQGLDPTIGQPQNIFQSDAQNFYTIRPSGWY